MQIGQPGNRVPFMGFDSGTGPAQSHERKIMAIQIVIDHKSPAHLESLLNRNGALVRFAVEPRAEAVPGKSGTGILRFVPGPFVLGAQKIIDPRLE